MFTSKAVGKPPLAYCAPCSERTPHRYERLGVNGRLTSRAICLICNNDSRQGSVPQKAPGPFAVSSAEDKLTGFS
jgi:hypothetical protein